MSTIQQDFDKTPGEYLLEDDSLDSGASEFQCYIRCFSDKENTKIDGYLSATSTEWATVVGKKHRWNLVKNKSDNTKFYLKNLESPVKNYYLGSRDATKCAGLYRLKMNGDWLTYDSETKKLINLTAGRTFFGRHVDGGYYWITDSEASGSDYVKIKCEIIHA
jgi:hypothetical protein